MARRESPDQEPTDQVLVIKRVLDAPRELVFKAWTEPERMMKWWGPKGFIATSVEVDLRPGGKWRVDMRSPEGQDYPSGGVYREIVEPERLVFTFVWLHRARPNRRGDAAKGRRGEGDRRVTVSPPRRFGWVGGTAAGAKPSTVSPNT